MGGEKSASTTKNSNIFGTNPQLANDRIPKNYRRISGIGSVMNTIRLTICMTSTRNQKRAGFSIEPAPPVVPALTLVAVPTTAAVTPTAPAAVVIMPKD